MTPTIRAERVIDPPAPFAALEKAADLPFVLLLESAARDDPDHSRYSWLAAAPREVLIARGFHVERWERVAAQALGPGAYRVAERLEGPPLRILGERLASRARPSILGLPPFQSGAAGLLSYELARTIERIPAPARNELDVPDLAVGLYDAVVAWDHHTGRTHVIAREPADGETGPTATEQIEAWLARLAGPAAPLAERPGPRLSLADLEPSFALDGTIEVRSNFSHEGYVEAVARVVEYIRAGDVFQVNLAQRLLAPARGHPLDFYRKLRATNPAAFAAYFDIGEHVVASSSPELFLSVRDREVITRPIKGTRPRGVGPEEDAYRVADLRASEKDRAENVMIVDLLRNDLSRVSHPRSVSVPRLFELERHPTVWHLVSEVRGELRPDKTAIDLIEATFPGGSITGAPKIRAMEIIAELEGTARGAYCGSLAWIDDGGDLGASILIRTATLSRGLVQLPVGGGITAASRPEDEYQETLDKARGMLRALGAR